MTTTERETIEKSLAELRTYRRNLRSEAIRTPDAKSRDDRMTEVNRVTRQIARMLARIGE
jgi:hypothetical protein